MHVFSLCKTRSNAAMRFCTCHGAGNIIETLHNLVRNNISGLIFIWSSSDLFKQVVLFFTNLTQTVSLHLIRTNAASLRTYHPNLVKLRYCCI